MLPQLGKKSIAVISAIATIRNVEDLLPVDFRDAVIKQSSLRAILYSAASL